MRLRGSNYGPRCSARKWRAQDSNPGLLILNPHRGVLWLGSERACPRARPHLGHISAEPQAGSLLTTLDLGVLIYDTVVMTEPTQGT